ncbi:hypothetical protein BDQ17DRAFT_214848, partial [Cyathus striatus]
VLSAHALYSQCLIIIALPPTSEALVTVPEYTQVFRYITLLTYSYYDYCTTLSAEVSLIWSSRWNMIKILFIIVCYYPFIHTTIGLYGVFSLRCSL